MPHDDPLLNLKTRFPLAPLQALVAQAEFLEKLGLPAERRDVGNQAGSPPRVAAERLPA